MTMSNFQACLDHTLKHEGGWSNHPRDPGGATMQGVTQRTYDAYRKVRGRTKQSVRFIAPHELRDIYHSMYWDKVRGDKTPAGVDLVGFDAAVNSGPSRSIKWLQKAARVAVDGAMGPKTLEALRGPDGPALIQRACAARMGFLRGLGTFTTFGRGWSRRVAEVEAAAVAMWATAAGTKRTDIAEAASQFGKDATEQAKAATASAATRVVAGTGAGGAGTLPEINTWLAIGLAGVLIVLALRALARAGYEKERARAYVALEMEVGA